MTNSQNESVEGVLLVDKPIGLSSHDVVNAIRRTLKQKRVGHAGTLDPFATGLLVILVGRYTKASTFLTEHDKWYDAQVDFSRSTATEDREGETLEVGDFSNLSGERIQEMLHRMLGEQLQQPPVYSAISIGGKRAYDLARRGEEVALAKRPVCFYHLELLKFEAPYADIRVHCSKGTYIRAFARDLGEALGIPAHLSALRRRMSGSYTVDGALPASAFGESEVIMQHLQKGPLALKDIPIVQIDAEEARDLMQGKRLLWNKAALVQEQPYMAVYDDNLIAFVKLLGDRLVSIRGF